MVKTRKKRRRKKRRKTRRKTNKRVKQRLRNAILSYEKKERAEGRKVNPQRWWWQATTSQRKDFCKIFCIKQKHHPICKYHCAPVNVFGRHTTRRRKKHGGGLFDFLNGSKTRKEKARRRKEKEEQEETQMRKRTDQEFKLHLAAAAEKDYLASENQKELPNIEKIAKMRTAARTAWEYFMTTDPNYKTFLYETWKVNWGERPFTGEEFLLLQSLKRYDPVGYAAINQQKPPS